MTLIRGHEADKRQQLLTPVDVSKKPTTRLVPKSADKGMEVNTKDYETRIMMINQPLQQKLQTMDSHRNSV